MKAEEIREQSYLLKCRKLSEIYRKEEEEKIEFCSGKIRKFKGIFQRFLDGIPVKNHEDMTAYMNFFTEKCDLIEDIYILREDGMQVSDAVMSPNVMIRNRKMFSAPRKGDYHGFSAPVVIDLGVLFHLLEPEDLVGQGIVVFLIADGFDELFLQFLHPSLNSVRREGVGRDNGSGYVLLQLALKSLPVAQNLVQRLDGHFFK